MFDVESYRGRDINDFYLRIAEHRLGLRPASAFPGPGAISNAHRVPRADAIQLQAVRGGDRWKDLVDRVMSQSPDD